jgi:hypothetical protein
MRRKGFSGPSQPAAIATEAVGRCGMSKIHRRLEVTKPTPLHAWLESMPQAPIHQRKRRGREACATSEVSSGTLFLLS